LIKNNPNLTPLYKSSETVGSVLKKGDIVIYESTVYPGVTEEECVPVLERVSGMQFNVDFFAGYSPERINPGDKEHTVEKFENHVGFYTRNRTS
jgi:UDP-N-acetyl-D-galactosamine dehydrogenase